MCIRDRNTAIYSPSGASVGVGFAVPVDTVNRVVPKIIEQRGYQPPRLGITIDRRVSEVVMKRLDMKGVLVAGVQEESGAGKAGLQGTRLMGKQVLLGDIITQIDGREVSDMDELMAALDKHEVGDSVTVRFVRGGKVGDAQIELQ